MPEVKTGLQEVVVAESAISAIDGGKGTLTYRGYEIDDLAEHSTFEEVVYLLWNGRLPKAEELDEILLAMREEGLVTSKQDIKAMVEDRFAVAGGEYNKASQGLFSRLERANGFHTQAAKQ